jgi:hypothetical protein
MEIIQAGIRVLSETENLFWQDENFHKYFIKLNNKNGDFVDMMQSLRTEINSRLGSEVIKRKDLTRENPIKRIFTSLMYGTPASIEVWNFFSALFLKNIFVLLYRRKNGYFFSLES